MACASKILVMTAVLAGVKGTLRLKDDIRLAPEPTAAA